MMPELDEMYTYFSRELEHDWFLYGGMTVAAFSVQYPGVNYAYWTRKMRNATARS